MKIVIISDLHANFAALQAFPEDCDELWVLGDLVNYGPQPSEVVEFVRHRAAAVVRGNHDHAVGYSEDPQCSPRFRQMAKETQRFSEQSLSEDQKNYLRELPTHLELTRASTRFYLCHARPSDPLYGYCDAHSQEWASEVQRVTSDILLVGHTHTSFIRNFGERMVVNPGSVGQPKTGRPEACYAVWKDGEITLKSFAYPVAEVVDKLEALPVSAEVRSDLIRVLRTGLT